MFLMTSGMNFLCLLILLKAAGPSELLDPSSLVMSEEGEKYWLLGGLTVYCIGEIP